MKSSSGSTDDPRERVCVSEIVRTDSKAQKLDAFLQPANNLSSVPCLIASPPKPVPATATFEEEMSDCPEELLANATNDMQTDRTEASLR